MIKWFWPVLAVAVLAGPEAVAYDCIPINADNARLLYAPRSAQEIREDELRAASARLEIELTLDRQEYSSRQTAELRVSLHNPTSERLEVWNPFAERNMFLYTDSPECPLFLSPRDTRWVEPGQTIEQVYRSGEYAFHIPTGLGEHRVVFEWVGGTRSLPFRVVRPPQ